MGRKVINIIGNRYGKLTVMAKTNKKASNGCYYWKCRCDCGNEIEMEKSNLKRNKSCGKCIINTYDLDNFDYGIGYTTNGDKFYFDKEDYDKLKIYNWSKTGSGYLVNTKSNKCLSMSRYIMDVKDDMLVDHINHNTLDNRKSNLRICNYSQNNINKKCKGYTLRKDGKYEVNIRINGKAIYVGRYNTKEEALLARKQHFDKDHIEFEFKGEECEDNI